MNRWKSDAVTAWDDAFATILSDPDLAEAASYYAQGQGPALALRVARDAPDAAEQAFGASIVQATDVLSVAVADLPAVAIGDVFILADATELTVVSQPMRDVTQTAWQVMCRR
jgi:hypothetical protein